MSGVRKTPTGAKYTTQRANGPSTSSFSNKTATTPTGAASSTRRGTTSKTTLARAPGPPPVTSNVNYPTLSQAFGQPSPSPQQPFGKDAPSPANSAPTPTVPTPLVPPHGGVDFASLPLATGSFGAVPSSALSAAGSACPSGVDPVLLAQTTSRSLSPMGKQGMNPIAVAAAGGVGQAAGMVPPASSKVGDVEYELDTWDSMLASDEENWMKSSGAMPSAAAMRPIGPGGASALAAQTQTPMGVDPQITPVQHNSQQQSTTVAAPATGKQQSPVEVLNAVVAASVTTPGKSITPSESCSLSKAEVRKPASTSAKKRAATTTYTSNVSEAYSAAPTQSNLSVKSVDNLTLKERVEILVAGGFLTIPGAPPSTGSGGTTVPASGVTTTGLMIANGPKTGSVSGPNKTSKSKAQPSLSTLRGLRKAPPDSDGSTSNPAGSPTNKPSGNISTKSNRSCANTVGTAGTVGTIFREIVRERPMDRTLTDELRQLLEQRPSNPVEVECLRTQAQLEAARKSVRSNRSKGSGRRKHSPRSDAATRSHVGGIAGRDEEMSRRSGGSAHLSSDSFGSYATSNTISAISTSPSWCFGEQYKIGHMAPPGPENNGYDELRWDDTNRFIPIEGREVPVAVLSRRTTGQ